jgi:hypothetical protein
VENPRFHAVALVAAACAIFLVPFAAAGPADTRFPVCADAVGCLRRVAASRTVAAKTAAMTMKDEN